MQIPAARQRCLGCQALPWGKACSRERVTDLSVLHEGGQRSSDRRLDRSTLLRHITALREAHVLPIIRCAVQQQVSPVPAVHMITSVSPCWCPDMLSF